MTGGESSTAVEFVDGDILGGAHGIVNAESEGEEDDVPEFERINRPRQAVPGVAVVRPRRPHDYERDTRARIVGRKNLMERLKCCEAQPSSAWKKNKNGSSSSPARGAGILFIIIA